jgi:hypothetical protein
MFILDHISETWKQFFGLKILKFFDADPGSGIFLTLDLGWKNLDPGSRINIPNLLHCKRHPLFSCLLTFYTSVYTITLK